MIYKRYPSAKKPPAIHDIIIVYSRHVETVCLMSRKEGLRMIEEVLKRDLIAHNIYKEREHTDCVCSLFSGLKS